MLNYDVQNSVEVNTFILRAVADNQSVSAIKGPPPMGAKYSDGELIKRPVNIGFKNDVTLECVDVIYRPKVGDV